MRISKLGQNLTPSLTVELMGRVNELKAAGEKVISLNAGEPDFDTPAHITEACCTALRQGKTRYTAVSGIPELRRAICKKLKDENGVAYAPNEIVVGTGAKQPIYSSLLAVVDPGDEVIIITPCWVSYTEMVKMAGAVPVLVAADPTTYFPDIAAVKAAITPKTRALMINTPNNPTGAVYPKEILQALGDLAVAHDFYVISDEVYEKMTYCGKTHVCLAALSEEIRAHTIVVNGFSKAFAMTGWRSGYSAAPAALSKVIADIQGHCTSNSTTFVQWAALEALNATQQPVADMIAQFAVRRDYVLKRLAAMPGFRGPATEGAFYFFPDVSALYGKRFAGKEIKNSSDFSDYLLTEAKVVVVPGAAFENDACIRIAYANSMENLIAGLDAMEAAILKLQ